MERQPTSWDPQAAGREKYLVALSSVLAAVLLTGTKLGVGIWTNSLGILSEALHSALDLVAAGVTFWAVRVSARPADREHTYGHGKFENLSALFETLLLLFTCVWIVYEAVMRLFFRAEVEINPNIWAFLVVVLSIVVDISRSRALRRVALKYQSQALEADALHFSTDVWSSCVVFLGLVGVLVGESFNLKWLVSADAVAALGVAAIVVWVSLRLGKKSVDDLLDRVPEALRAEVEAAAAGVPGVKRVIQVRLRRAGPEAFADVTLSIDREAGLEEAHGVADRAEEAVRSVLPRADVVVHVEPAAGDNEDLVTTVRVVAARQRLGAHGIQVLEEQHRRTLELHVEVDESLSLEDAHRQVTEFEQALREALPQIDRIVTHIEPAGESAATRRAEPVGQLEVQSVLGEFLQAHPGTIRPHDVRVQQVGQELSVSLHCELDAGTSIGDAHQLTIELEEFLRSRIPNVGRVVIHAEPLEA